MDAGLHNGYLLLDMQLQSMLSNRGERAEQMTSKPCVDRWWVALVAFTVFY